VEVGVKFRADVNGSITALRFYKGSTNTTGVSTATNVTAMFSEAIDTATIGATTFELRNAAKPSSRRP